MRQLCIITTHVDIREIFQHTKNTKYILEVYLWPSGSVLCAERLKKAAVALRNAQSAELKKKSLAKKKRETRSN
jgi:hypothetical protein